MTAVRVVGFCAVVLALAGTVTVHGAPNGTSVIAGRLLARPAAPDGPPAPGVAGATVEAVAVSWPATQRPAFDEAPAAPLASAKSAADGTFRLEGVPPGRVGLVVRAPTIATTTFDGFVVQDGATYRGYELLCAEKPREAASRVVRKDGRPVAGLDVVAWDGGPERPLFGRREVGRAQTGADGSFRLTGSVARPAAWLRLSAGRFFDLQASFRDDAPAVATAGGDADLDLRVTDLGGKPAGDVRVRLAVGDEMLEGRTSADGHCRFARVAVGGFALVADAPGLAAVRIAAPSAAPSDAERLAPLAPGDDARTVVLERTCTLNGTVVSGADGAPVFGARVRFATTMSEWTALPETTTDASGRFTLRDLPRGAGVVVVDRDGWAQTERFRPAPWRFIDRAQTGGVRAGGPVPSPAVWFAEAGGSLERRFVLDLAPPTRFELRDRAGRAVVGAHLAFGPTSGAAAAEAFFQPAWRDAYADDAGRASADVPPGAAQLVVDAPGFLPKAAPLRAGRAAEPVAVVLERGGLADFRVVDGDLRPVAGAWIWRRSLRGEDDGADLESMSDDDLNRLVRGEAPTPTDAHGVSRALLPAGPVLVAVGRHGLLGTATSRVTVAEGGPTTYDVRLEPAGAVEGRVAWRGKPPANARVAVVARPRGAQAPASPEDSETADAEVAADGTFRVECVEAGRVAVVAYVVSATVDAVEEKSDPAEIDVAAGPATALRAPLELRPAK